MRWTKTSARWLAITGGGWSERGEAETAKDTGAGIQGRLRDRFEAPGHGDASQLRVEVGLVQVAGPPGGGQETDGPEALPRAPAGPQDERRVHRGIQLRGRGVAPRTAEERGRVQAVRCARSGGSEGALSSGRRDRVRRRIRGWR